jgi:hypothetical protein
LAEVINEKTLITSNILLFPTFTLGLGDQMQCRKYSEGNKSMIKVHWEEFVGMIHELFQDRTHGLFVQLRNTISAETPRVE